MHYYNEFDPQAAAWLQVLIDQHLIPEGVVDTRSIVEVTAADLGGFVQCHFFAGIGGWPLALQLAGVPASTRLWTGSCPCQPFSVAGEGKGTADERHLWPVFFELIRACNPPLVFGEQVASAAVLGSSAKPTKRSAGKAVQPVWLDGVFADLESAGYACGSSDIPAAGVGAPHIRQRCWWGAVRMADSERGGCESGSIATPKPTAIISSEDGSNSRMADSLRDGQSGPGILGRSSDSAEGENREEHRAFDVGRSGGMAYTQGEGSSPGSVGTAFPESREKGEGSCGVEQSESVGCAHGKSGGSGEGVDQGACGRGQQDGPGLSPSAWNDSRWHPCRDGKYRRVPTQSVFQHVVNELSGRVDLGGDFSPEEISLIAEAAQGFPLASSEAFKVLPRGTVRPGLLKGAGNAIVPQVGAEFVKAFYEVITP